MSKFTFAIAVVTVAFSWLTYAETNTSMVQKEVMASFESLVQASKELNHEAYFEHFDTEKFVGLNSDGSNWNSIDELSPLIINGFASIKAITQLTFTNVKISVIDQHTAILVNEYTQSMELNNGHLLSSAGGGTQVWSKRTGAWKLVSVSASNKP
ncbi:nuclear transport factor 2 family protein [Paraglaciecola arctica]|uniref:nuclear transport factor 2 family protein n=1 Tax=Paraglaciecola arctica TaxID=1128911 RepID=UPI001C06C184|nr:nuclear transport factor 2 family protein [Paraglaciecola arctica]MBU3003928.1 nuclear transport factor 2 family protein [Paraglaciecola arctica]